ncbi:hypothetical protein ACHAWO_002058 [Cyclotella atomus]|jgi:predicted esterase|uniref:Serine hydrolase domain-containing protein n=1 Tax=Cyclotella atomus TaxID=382360 RepID=A0ABD3PQV8_9STRA
MKLSQAPVLLLATLPSRNTPTAALLQTITRLYMTTESSTAAASKKPKILCLHGKFQNAATFSNKIAGARRKLAREYDLHFIDGPIVLEEGYDGATLDENDLLRSWWVRSSEERHILVREALEYAIGQTDRHEMDAILGFSQGGTLATALALSGAFPNLKCVVTAGAPFVTEALDEAAILAEEYSDCITGNSDSLYEAGLRIPKFHMAGENDALVPAESTKLLCEKGGSGTFVMHEQGHLFPTRSGRVQEVLDFLANHSIK